MTGFLRLSFWHFLRKEEFLNRFFYLEFDASILDDRKAHHQRSECDRGQPSASSLNYPKEEPAKELTIDLENRRYSFYLRPRWDEV
jgi:hypothetical protein